MPIKKYKIETDKGSFEIEVEVPDQAEPAQTADQKLRAARPAGFDDNPLRAAAGGFVEGAVEGAKGFAKEIVPGVGKAALAIPGGIYSVLQMAMNTAGGVGDLVSDPVGTLSSLAESAGNLPAKAKKALDSAMALAANDPQAFGNAVADVTADVGVGIATSKLLPTAVKPVAKKTGELMQTVGTKGEWPIRMVGAHQLGSGNPLGAVIMGAPEGLVAAGKKLEKFGGGGVAKLDVAEARFAKDIEQELSKSLKGNPAKDALSELDAAIASEKKNAGAIRMASGKREAAARAKEEAADMAKLQADEATAAAQRTEATKVAEEMAATAEIEAAKKGLVKGQPQITETVKAPGQSMRTSYGPPEDPSGLTPIEKAVLERSKAGRSGLKKGVTAADIDPARADVLAPKTPAPKPAGGLTDADVRTLNTTDDFGQPLSKGDMGLDIEDAGVADIPATKSRNPLSTVDDRLTTSDMDTLKRIVAERPDISTEDAMAEMLKERSQRSTMYRNEAGLSKLGQSILDREEF